jgi:predicted enzyme related to lactoylglutathione lyase
MTNPPGSIVWYELMTTQPDRAKTFYDAVAGWDTGPPAEGPVDYRMIRRGPASPTPGNVGGMLRLDDTMLQHGARPTWLLYFGVDDVDAITAAIVADGGTALVQPWDAPGVGRIAMLTDPQGNPFYVMRPQPPADMPDATSDVFAERAIGHFAWNELATADPEAAIAFYACHFGIEEAGRMPMGEMGEYHFLTHAGLRIGAAMRRQPDQPPGWMVVVRVASVDASAVAIEQHGGAIVRSAMQIPGDDWLVIATDPDNIRFAVVGDR